MPSRTSSSDNCADFLTSKDLQNIIEASEIIIARSGYSTIMDLVALGKKAIFIPTPGQTEQEYLAQRLMEKGMAYYMSQASFNLAAAMEASKKFSGLVPAFPDGRHLKQAMQKLIGSYS